MKDLKELLKNASLEDLQSLVQEKKQEIKKEAEKNDFFKKVFEIRSFFRDRNLSLNDFRKMESFFKKSKKAAKSNNKENMHKNFKALLDNGYNTFIDDKGREKIKIKILEIKKQGNKKAIGKDEEKIDLKIGNLELKDSFIFPKVLENLDLTKFYTIDKYGYIRN
jgi:hypothetical protein